MQDPKQSRGQGLFYNNDQLTIHNPLLTTSWVAEIWKDLSRNIINNIVWILCVHFCFTSIQNNILRHSWSTAQDMICFWSLAVDDPAIMTVNKYFVKRKAD